MARKAEGQLILRKSGYLGRFTAPIEGEAIRVTKKLNTHNRVVARRRLDRLIAEARATPEGTTRAAIDAAAKAVETFEQAARRVHKMRLLEIMPRNAERALRSFEELAFPVIGHMPVAAVKKTDINSILDAAKAAGQKQGSLKVLKAHLSAVFIQCGREDESIANPTRGASMPKFAMEVVRERAVLTDEELRAYLAYRHPWAGAYQFGVLERQTMGCMSRVLGGMRTNDLHHLRWESLDAELGAFMWARVPRRKSRRPQLLNVPAMLRPIIRHWWELAGRPVDGLIFPKRRKRKGQRPGDIRQHGHAGALRLDLQRAFRGVDGMPQPGSARWRELFTECEETRPVDFHSFRRSFAQALADSGVPSQQALVLTGHSNMATHARYLASSGRARTVPEAALPNLAVVPSEPEEKAPALGTDPDSPRFYASHSARRNAPNAAVRHSGASSRVPTVRVIGDTKSSKSGVLVGKSTTQKAPAVPEVGDLAEVTTLPAAAHVGLLDLLRAADMAVLAGELHRARQLLAAAMAHERRDRAARRRNG